eukprot:1141163-Pelagomonas_calceolata.AAC.5
MSSEPELEDAEGSAEAIAKANPSALFSLDCTLPEVGVNGGDPFMSTAPELEDAEGSDKATAKANPSALFSLDCLLP